MSEPIKVGDLVMVVKKNVCGCDWSVGMVFKVIAIDRTQAKNWCCKCGALYGPFDQAVNGVWGAALYRLKRIPPLSELESEKREEDIREPA